MKDVLDYLKQLDLSDIEAKLYLTLLKTGPMSVRDLAETIEIKRTTTYFYIDLLVEKGLVMKMVKKSKKVIAATPPSNLEPLVKNKLITAQELQKMLPSIKQSITALLPQHTSADEAEIASFKGLHGIKKIYDAALASTEVRSYVKVETTGGLYSDNFTYFNEAFKRNPHLTVREIIYDSPNAIEDAKKILTHNDRYQYKLMPKELNLTSGDILIYDGKVAILNYKGNISSVVLQSSDYYHNSKELFDFIWKMIP